jgi:hypothetical protein
MDDKKRLIGETEPEITDGAIAAWNRGKMDAERSKLLKGLSQLSPKRAVDLVKMYAQLGDIHYLATRFDIPVAEARKILAAFNIHSIEDAKKAVRDGIISEYDNAVEEDKAEAIVESQAAQAVAEEKFAEMTKAQEERDRPKTEAEIDATLIERRDEAQRKNKEDQIRQLIAEGINPDTGATSFRISLDSITLFKKMIPHGVSQLQRRFGGTAKCIVNEIKRLSPSTDIDMLRP